MKIKVPDIEHSTLCYKQEIKNNIVQTFIRCGLPKNHKGKHSWERKNVKKAR